MYRTDCGRRDDKEDLGKEMGEGSGKGKAAKL